MLQTLQNGSYVSYVDFLCALCMCRDVGFFLWNQLCENFPGSVDYEGRLQDIVGMVGYAVLCIFMVQTFVLQQPLFVLNSALSISHLRIIFSKHGEAKFWYRVKLK